MNWSEKSDIQKVGHVLRQIGHFGLLWLLTFWSVFNRYSNIFYYNVLPPSTSNTGNKCVFDLTIDFDNAMKNLTYCLID